MKTDVYTKVLLTIIAFCLTFNVLKDLEIIQTAQAKTAKAELKDWFEDDAIKVHIVKVGKYKVNYKIPVEAYNP